MSKGKRSSKSASPKLVKQPETTPLITDAEKESRDSAVLTVDVPITDQVDIITKVRSRRKMKKPQKPQLFADSKLLNKTVRDQFVAFLFSDRAQSPYILSPLP